MRGVITGKDVLLHPVTIIRAWGAAAYLHCLWAAITRNPTTFFGVLFPAAASGFWRTMLRGGIPVSDPRWRASR